MNQVFILLGSNIDKENNLAAAVQLLRSMCQVVTISPVYETIPVGLLAQPNFLNVAVLVASELGPIEIKQQILTPIEKQLKRVRKEDKNAPRTIDADLIMFNNEIGEWEGRQLPDPDMLRFAHVAVPVARLAPEMRHPETGEELQTLAERLLRDATARNNNQTPIWPRADMSRRLSTTRN